MSRLLVILLSLLLVCGACAHAEDILDRVEEASAFSILDGDVHGKISGLANLEAYRFSGTPLGSIFTSRRDFFNPRLILFADVQMGEHLYGFVQSRFDRGFNPRDNTTQLRLDEYALRLTPWKDGRFNFQVGKFATVVGNWVGRHLAWENPFINAPMLYDNFTAIYDAEIPASAKQFLSGATDDRYDYNPVVWGPSYATGASVSGMLGKFDYAAEIKNSSLSSRPESWELRNMNFAHPTLSARIGVRPDQAWNLGLSYSEGAYLVGHAFATQPPGTGPGDYHQQVIAQDISFAWHHLQIWAEVFEARFQVPNAGNADTLGYYIEAKYKFTPQLFGALRWNQMHFSRMSDGAGGSSPWFPDMWRVDAAVGFRMTAHTQLKLQYSLQHENVTHEPLSHMLAVQLTVRF
ncbi:hypothetical protein [Prosthecobacter vanneervenii]|uniref:Phosphate-selective porin O and P n=1 Tax=Prosthecobacter vanneervenii TaxID=48466 RepID=A0A7W7YB41_9BACT|nr:hypothetical protein [Prosthecobacter vanneervenii]MBB5032948.1 hypothetical protein [Prosthecobacter vanneervenii]